MECWVNVVYCRGVFTLNISETSYLNVLQVLFTSIQSILLFDHSFMRVGSKNDPLWLNCNCVMRFKSKNSSTSCFTWLKTELCKEMRLSWCKILYFVLTGSESQREWLLLPLSAASPPPFCVKQISFSALSLKLLSQQMPLHIGRGWWEEVGVSI